MKARCITDGIILDYTHVSAPLTFDIIQKDIAEIQSDMFREVSEIVVWKHQWNWLVDQCQPLTDAAEHAVGIQVGDSLSRVKIRPVKTIYGIPLRLAN